MPELIQKERLQLSLLDRLTDADPTSEIDRREDVVIGLSKLRELVQRDLSWLFNTVSAQSTQDLSSYSELPSSCVNFGIVDLSSFSGNLAALKMLERDLVRSVKAFEPRIIASTLKIKVEHNEQVMNRNRVTFEISGDLWAQPVPLQLFLRTEFNLEDGSVSLLHWS